MQRKSLFVITKNNAETMKMIITGLLIALVAWACSPSKNAVTTSAVVNKSSEDSTIYELIIENVHFDHWYLIRYSPAKDHSEEYYRQKNIIAVSNWNEFYRQGRFRNVINSYIDYWPNISYGMELNRKLFWYFTFVKEEYKIKLFN